MKNNPKIQTKSQEANTDFMQDIFEEMILLLGRLVYPPKELTPIIMKI